jgi:hypothetical protein
MQDDDSAGHGLKAAAETVVRVTDASPDAATIQ